MDSQDHEESKSLAVACVGPDSMNIEESEGRSWYDALEVSLTRRLVHGFQFSASYTFSKTLDTDEFLNALNHPPVCESRFKFLVPYAWRYYEYCCQRVSDNWGLGSASRSTLQRPTARRAGKN